MRWTDLRTDGEHPGPGADPAHLGRCPSTLCVVGAEVTVRLVDADVARRCVRFRVVGE